MIYLKLFFEFFKIGLFAVGGGLATLPFLREIVYKYGWISTEDLADMIAISESTPGPIGINMATYTGYKTGGLPGGIIATLGLVTPSIIIIVLIAYYFMKYSEEPIVRSAFYGLRPAVVGLIGAAGFEVAKITLFNLDAYMRTHNILDIINLKSAVLFLAILYLLNKYKKHPLVYIAGAAVIGIVFKY